MYSVVVVVARERRDGWGGVGRVRAAIRARRGKGERAKREREADRWETGR